jgi:hypothetical protein
VLIQHPVAISHLPSGIIYQLAVAPTLPKFRLNGSGFILYKDGNWNGIPIISGKEDGELKEDSIKVYCNIVKDSL